MAQISSTHKLFWVVLGHLQLESTHCNEFHKIPLISRYLRKKIAFFAPGRVDPSPTAGLRVPRGDRPVAPCQIAGLSIPLCLGESPLPPSDPL